MALQLWTRIKGLPRWQKFGLAAALGILLYTLIGFLALPPIVRLVAVSQLSKQLKREVQIETVRMNPYVLSATVRNMAVFEPDGENRLAAFREFHINLQAISLFKWAPVLKEVRLDGLYAYLALHKDGRWNFSDLLPASTVQEEPPAEAEASAEDEPFRFSLNNIQLTDGEIHFQDAVRGKTHHITGIEIALPFLSNLPAEVDIFVSPRFMATINDTDFDLQGQVKPFAGSRATELLLDFEGIDLAAYMPYVPPEAGVRIQSGALDIKFSLIYETFEDGRHALHSAGTIALRDLDLRDGDDRPLAALDQLKLEIGALEPLEGILRIQEIRLQAPTITLARRKTPEAAEPPGATQPLREVFRSINLPPPVVDIAQVTLEEARLKIRDLKSASEGATEKTPEHTLVALPRFSVEGTRVDVDRQDVRVRKIDGREGIFELRRLADGGLNLDLFLASGGEGQTPPPAQAEPWQVDVENLALANYTINGIDLVPDDPVKVTVDAIDLNVTDFSTRPEVETTVALNGRINETGHFKSSSTLILQPLQADSRLTLEQVDLAAFYPFLKPYMGVVLADGDLGVEGDLTLRSGEEGSPTIVYTGRAAIRSFRTLDRQAARPFVTWQALNLDGMDIGVNPTYLTIREISVTQPFSRVLIDENGRLNLAAAAGVSAGEAADQEAAAPTAEASQETVPVPIRIGTLKGRGGKLIFADRSFKPGFQVVIEDVETTVSGLSSEASDPAQVEIRGKVEGHAPVAITGEIQPLAGEMYADLAFDFRQVDLTAASPYAGRYVGRTISQGKLNIQSAYHIENQALKARHDILIDQFNFGQRVESPDDLDLPVDLAVALLKDRSGKITINLPVSGDMNDPKFSIGGIVLQAFVNLIVKAVTSPFALLGSMFEGQDLSHLEFDPGRARLAPETAEKLDALAQILYDRPALQLEIAGYADPAADAPALADILFQRKLKSQKVLELADEGQTDIALDDITIAADEYEELLQAAYEAATFEKPTNFIGIEKTLPPEEAEAMIREHIEVGQTDLEELAYARALAVKDYLLDTEKVEAERVFLVKPPNVLAPEPLEGAAPTRVDLGLTS